MIKSNTTFMCPPLAKRLQGFSLVEVTIALGLVAFAVVTVLALLPTGLTSIRESIDETVRTQISQQIAADVLQTPFVSVTDFTRYYDNEGFPVSGETDAIFTAKIEPTTVSYPGSDLLASVGTSLDDNLKSLKVTITTRATKNLSERFQSTFHLLLARKENLRPSRRRPEQTMFGEKRNPAFTLIEMLVGMTLLLLIMGMLFGIVSGITSIWSGSMQRIDAFQGARVAFDRVTKMLSQATLNVYWDYDDPNNPTVYRRQSELAFAVLQTGSEGFSGAGTGHGVFFQVPVGATEKTGSPDFQPLSQMLSSVGFSVRWLGDKNIRPPFIDGPEKLCSLRMALPLLT